MTINKKIFLAIAILIGLSICVIVPILFKSYFVNQGVVDCAWDDTALAWIDENQNGVWEDNEKPLAGVKFLADDIQHEYDTSDESISDATGKAKVYIFPVYCEGFDDIKVVISAIPPEGYKPTTPIKISVPIEAKINYINDNFFFGFIPKDQ